MPRTVLDEAHVHPAVRMMFVKGVLVDGAQDLEKLIHKGEINK